MNWDWWRSVLGLFGSPERPRQYAGEWMWPDPRWPVEGIQPIKGVSRAIVVSKEAVERGYAAEGIVPEETAIRALWWTAVPHCRQSCPQHSVYITDLDPPGLVQYLALKHGCDEEDPILDVVFGGLDEGIDLEALVGTRSAGLLRTGFTYDTVITSPSHYGDGFVIRIRELLSVRLKT